MVHRAAALPGRSKPHLTGTCAVGDGCLRNGESREHAVGVADVKEHAFGNLASHAARFQIHHEERLTPFELSRVLALFFEAREDGALVVPEIDRQFNDFKWYLSLEGRYVWPMPFCPRTTSASTPSTSTASGLPRALAIVFE